MTDLSLPFTPVLPPLRHQADFLRDHGLDAAYGLFHEQGTGKTKSLIDNAAQLLALGKVDRMLVIAPNGVHANWPKEELPKHWPAGVLPYRAFEWDTNRAGNKSFQRDFEAFCSLDAASVFPILCMSYDSLMTDAGKKASWRVLKQGRVVYAADESQRIKDPATKRNVRVLASSVYADYRRIASGTPMDTPLDIYAQVRFLDPEFWVREAGIAGFTAFKAQFGVYESMHVAGGVVKDILVGYRNLEQLQGLVAKVGSRVLKKDVLDLPPKVFKRVYHPLTRDQRTAYDELREEAMTTLRSGELVTAEMALVLQLRLSQICCGYVNPSAGAKPIPFAENPRARYYGEFLKDQTRPVITWHRFRPDVDAIVEASRKAGRRPAVYDGSRPGDALDAFHAGKVDDLIANIGSSMIEGYTLNEASTVAYYSRSPRLIPRMQSEDRCHRIGQTESVLYVDFMAEGTQDSREVTRLVKKRRDTGFVLGDEDDEWLAGAERIETPAEWLMDLVSEGEDEHG